MHYSASPVALAVALGLLNPLVLEEDEEEGVLDLEDEPEPTEPVPA